MTGNRYYATPVPYDGCEKGQPGQMRLIHATIIDENQGNSGAGV